MTARVTLIILVAELGLVTIIIYYVVELLAMPD
jgi:hypothetical protein